MPTFPSPRALRARRSAALVILPLLCAASATRAAPRGLQVLGLRCEYRTQPLGVDEPRPRLSWMLSAPNQRGQRQTAYQILAASSPKYLRAGRADLWDSGRVASDETAHISYNGRALRSGQTVFWQVRAWDKNNRPSAPATSSWTTGLMQPTDWKARWIGARRTSSGAGDLAGLSWVWSAEDGAGNPPAGARFFRRQFELPADRAIKSARFTATADDQFTLHVNGRLASQSDGQTDAWRRPVTASVAAHLRTGPNVLAIEAGNSGDAAGLIGRLVIEFQNGEPLSVPVDGSWKSARQSAPGWQQAGFDDSGWSVPRVIAAIGAAPWGMPGQSSAIPPASFLRKSFVLGKPIRRALIYATALGLYELHLNGARVGNDVFAPGWSDYHKRALYQTYDVTRQLSRGQNTLGIILGDGWATGHDGNGGRDRYGFGRPVAAAQLSVEFADGSRQVITTDNSWKSSLGPIDEQDLLDGEVYDARRELPHWDRAVFNDAAWQPVEERLDANFPSIIQAYPGVPVRKQLELKPKRVWQSSPGRWVFDLGQNMVGWARLQVLGPAGTRIGLRFAEMLNPDGSVYTANMRGARAQDAYTLRGGGIETWEPRFTFHGFRYVELAGFPGTPTADAITGVVLHSDTPQSGTFESSVPLVNQLQRNIEWGQRGNFLEVPTDCPQRDERAGWLGDAQVFVRTAAYNRDVSAFFSKWMQDVDDAQRGGVFSDIAPDICCGAGTPAWADAGLIVPWTMYQMYGDKRVLSKHYAAMRSYVEAIARQNPNHLWQNNRGSDYGDWLSIGADTPKDVIGTAYFAHSTDLLRQVAQVLGNTQDEKRYSELFNNIRDAFNKEYVSADGRIKGDTQTNYLMALRFGLLPADKQRAAASHLVADIEKRQDHLSTGFVGVGLLNPTLTQFGQEKVAHRLLQQDSFPSWGFSIRHGATTIWERWDGWTPDKGFQDAGMNSFNHYALGSVGEWLYETVGGIAPDPSAPGFKRILIRPRPDAKLNAARTIYDSIRGRIISDWKVQNGSFSQDLTIPPNASATVWIPGAAGAQVLEGGQPVSKAPGVRYLRDEDGAAVLSVEAGTYRFSTRG